MSASEGIVEMAKNISFGWWFTVNAFENNSNIVYRWAVVSSLLVDISSIARDDHAGSVREMRKICSLALNVFFFTNLTPHLVSQGLRIIFSWQGVQLFHKKSTTTLNIDR
jgi:hypothetical protein